MPESDKPRVDDSAKKKPEFKVPARTYVIWIAIIGLIPLIAIFRQNKGDAGQHLRQHEFIQKVSNDLIATATITLDPQSPYLRDIRGRYFKADPGGQKAIEQGKPVEVPFYAQVYLTDQILHELLNRPQFQAKRPNTLLSNLIWSLGPILLVALLIYFVFIRQLKSVARMEQKRQMGDHEKPRTEVL